jgi:DNA-binding NtrC family response regulator
MISCCKGNETILVVDDDKKILRLLSDFLDMLGYKVIIAKDGVEGVNKYIQHLDSISVVLMDIVMPLKDGITAYNEIKALNSRANVLLFSGYTAEHSDKIPDCALIQKPISPTKIAKIIRTVIDTTNAPHLSQHS